ncbi:NUDIX domain-containing protein [Candidatus Woesearchaeota archaeon]|nr:NUDIX domain-containing protein [Candidatus Woesearchaeota archaeon]
MKTMGELLDAFDEEGQLVKTLEKELLLREMKDYSYKHRDSPFAVPVVHLMLSNSQGQLYVIKRGDKDENPNKYCKSVGGHVRSGEPYETTLQRETLEEIGTDIIVTDESVFEKAKSDVDTTKYAVVKRIGFDPWLKSIRKVKNGRSWTKRVKAEIFVGIYDGNVSFKDGEAVEMLLINKQDLIKRISDNSDDFTYDLRRIMSTYYRQL